MTEQQVGQAHGYIKAGDKEKLRARLRRIEGQVRGVQRMIDEERYCVDILTQISSYIRASEKVALLVLRDHMDHCVREALADGENAGSKPSSLTTRRASPVWRLRTMIRLVRLHVPPGYRGQRRLLSIAWR